MRRNRYSQRRQSGHGLGGKVAHALLLVGAALVLFGSEVQAQSVSAYECCASLLQPYGARAVSLGQALTARASVDGLFFNPASLANSGRGQFIAHHATTFESQNNAFTILIDAGLAGSFALTYVLVDFGDDPVRDTGGQVIGEFNTRDQQLIASYATGVTNVLRAGVSYTLFNKGNFCTGICAGAEASGTTHLLDLGIQARVPRLPSLEIGASILHVGFSLQQKNAEQADPPPSRVRLGAAYELWHHFRADSSITVWVSADVVNRLRSPTTPAGGIGVEVAFDQIIFIRAGYGGSGDALAQGAAGVGVGIRYQRFNVGVSKAFSLGIFDSGSDQFQVSFAIQF
jgi:hypothetical protein